MNRSITVIAMSISVFCNSQHVIPDVNFGSNGILSIADGGADNGLLIQPDGKILCYQLIDGSYAINNHTLTRVNANGTIDTSFGENGRVYTTMGVPFPYNEGLSKIALQPDGKILIAGSVGTYINNSYDNYEIGILRLNPDGSVDAAFGTNGIATTDINPNSPCWGQSLEVLSNGKILVAGEINFANADFGVMQYNANGTLDTSFGTNGFVSVNFGPFGTYPDEYVRNMRVQSDGMIVLGGYGTAILDSPQHDFSFVRLRANGQIDTTFGNNGLLASNFGGFDQTYSFELTADDRIIAVGFSQVQGWGWDPICNAVVIKYNYDGTPDTSFGINGQMVLHISQDSEYEFDRLYDVVLQDDGKLLCVGHVYDSPSSPGNLLLSRFHPDGTLDDTFDLDGYATSDAGPSRTIALTNQGDIMCGLVNGVAKFTFGELSQNDFDIDGFTVYPNPFVDYLEIQIGSIINSPVKMSLCDMAGRSIHRDVESALQNRIRFELPSVVPGTYILKMEIGDSIVYKKVVRQ